VDNRNLISNISAERIKQELDKILLSKNPSLGFDLLISTGIADYEDIRLAVDTCRNAGNNEITLLKCTTAYPAPVEEANLIMLRKIAKDFDVRVGVSDHTLGSIIPVLSVAFGAKVIEKHFILNKSVGGPDASFSLDESEFKEMVLAVRQAEKAIGIEDYTLTEKQIQGRRFARSLYITEDIKAGEIITKNNVRSIRPGFGLHPKHYKDILGKKVVVDLFKGERFQLNFIEK
jgi:pseudaminic acid synthase